MAEHACPQSGYTADALYRGDGWRHPTHPGGDHSEGNQGALQKVFAVLETVANEDRPLSVSELAALREVPTPTMHRIVRQLEEEGLLTREAQPRGYGPAPRLLRFAIQVVRSSMRSAPHQAVLSELASRVGETCNFGMMVGDAVVYLHRIETAWPFGLRFEPGSRVPMHCTSMGKLFLAYQPKRRRHQIISSGPLYRYTDNTITDPEELESQFSMIRNRGYSLDNQEFLAGVVCLAVPVHDTKGGVCAAVAISAPQARMRVEDAESHVPEMLKAVKKLESFLAENNEHKPTNQQRRSRGKHGTAL